MLETNLLTPFKKGGSWNGPSGPGPQDVIASNSRDGFFGEIPSNEFIDGIALANHIGLTAGTAQNNTTPWLKVHVGEKILFVPKMTFRHSVSWDHIYQAGAVYGTNNNGLNPTGTPRNQYKTITIQGYTFIIRLLKGAKSDPCQSVFGYGLSATFDSEWDRIFYPLSVVNTSGNYPQNNQDGPDWAAYTDVDLGCNSTNNYSSWCQERHLYNTSYRVIRGVYSCSRLARDTSSYAPSSYGWRPCLEVILPT